MTTTRDHFPQCPHCSDTGFRGFDDEKGVRYVDKCDCRRARERQQRLVAAGIPKEYQHCTFDNFNAYHPQLERARLKVRQYVEAFPNIGPGAGAKLGLFLQGLPGTGKSHLAAAALTEIVRRDGTWAVFADTRELLRLIRHSYNPTTRTSEYEILRPIMHCDLLVLDDLGAERPTDWVEETMNLIVNTRYSECRRTIITTNYPDGPIDDPNTLECRIGFRMRSRVAEMCEFIEVDGADYRHQPPNFTNRDLLASMKVRTRTLPSLSRGPGRHTPVKDGKADLKWPGGRGGNI